MQRMISHTEPLPNCRNGHRARHMHDVRRAEAGGGHLVECACSATAKHAEFDTALVEWCRANGHPCRTRCCKRRFHCRTSPS